MKPKEIGTIFWQEIFVTILLNGIFTIVYPLIQIFTFFLASFMSATKGTPVLPELWLIINTGVLNGAVAGVTLGLVLCPFRIWISLILSKPYNREK